MGFPQVRHCGLFIGLGVGVFFKFTDKNSICPSWKWNFIVHFSLSAKECQNIRIMLTIFRGEGRIQPEKAEPAGTNRFRREGCGGDVLWVKHVIGCYVRLVQKVRKGRFPYANGNGYGLAHHGKGGKWAGSGIPRVSFGWQVHNKAFHL